MRCERLVLFPWSKALEDVCWDQAQKLRAAERIKCIGEAVRSEPDEPADRNGQLPPIFFNQRTNDVPWVVMHRGITPCLQRTVRTDSHFWITQRHVFCVLH
ncbi:hypothetical protein CHARACLAT_023936 [Characodon lateralis]|uniref:Uncharacterized protein n=1 Tax=Characodon lateralis TaxID=208331 RepID=A0ABU7F6U2_9TELE|nr:hypothetical protein [Characodon lateralis]